MREAKFSLVGTPNPRGVYFTALWHATGLELWPTEGEGHQRTATWDIHSSVVRAGHEEDSYVHIPLPCLELVYFSQLLHLTARRGPSEIQNLSKWRTVEILDVPKSGKSLWPYQEAICLSIISVVLHISPFNFTKYKIPFFVFLLHRLEVLAFFFPWQFALRNLIRWLHFELIIKRSFKEDPILEEFSDELKWKD